MSLPAIEVSGLSKRYVIEHESRHDTLRDTLHHTARKLWRRFRWGTGFQREEFWALRDVNFSVQPGEVVGIIGRNGAGKSTLLKILSRITEPTAGKVTLRGRVASLLEVGTGFHPDLTGRENIYLNGAILGMRRAEIRAKFDEIVAFAEVEKFLNTPVKRYSSGMYVRLAFAVAAHLEPEILIVDEVLAVGDFDFQRKCLSKMNDVTQHNGRTILFVSHQLQAIQQLCNRTLVLNQGAVVRDGDTAGGLATYAALNTQLGSQCATVKLGQALRLQTLAFTPVLATPLEDLMFEMVLIAEAECRIFDLCLLLYNSFGQRVAIADIRQRENAYRMQSGQSLCIKGRFGRLALIAGRYSVGLFVKTNNHIDDHMDLGSFEIKPAVSKFVGYAPEHQGTTAVDLTFSAEVKPSV